VKTRNCVKTLRRPSILFLHNFSFPQNLENGLYLLNIKRYKKIKSVLDTDTWPPTWVDMTSYPTREYICIRSPAIKCIVRDKTWAADLYLIYKLEPKATVCISDTDRMRMFYRTWKWTILWVHWQSDFKNKHCLSRENQSW
jgi:hypothetical protein